MEATSQRVVLLSDTAEGKKHDKKLSDETAVSFPSHSTLFKDTGFQSYEPTGVLTFQPQKKPRGQVLSVAARFLNKLIASVRMTVEHVICGVKRCRIVKDVFRNTAEGFSDFVMEISCGLHNLRVSQRQPAPANPLAWLLA